MEFQIKLGESWPSRSGGTLITQSKPDLIFKKNKKDIN